MINNHFIMLKYNIKYIYLTILTYHLKTSRHY